MQISGREGALGSLWFDVGTWIVPLPYEVDWQRLLKIRGWNDRVVLGSFNEPETDFISHRLPLAPHNKFYSKYIVITSTTARERHHLTYSYVIYYLLTICEPDQSQLYCTRIAHRWRDLQDQVNQLLELALQGLATGTGARADSTGRDISCIFQARLSTDCSQSFNRCCRNMSIIQRMLICLSDVSISHFTAYDRTYHHHLPFTCESFEPC